MTCAPVLLYLCCVTATTRLFEQRLRQGLSLTLSLIVVCTTVGVCWSLVVCTCQGLSCL